MLRYFTCDWLRLRHGLRVFLCALCLGFLRSCQSRDVVICTAAEHMGYAAQSSLFDFEEHRLHVTWFETASLIPLQDSGGCDVMQLPAYKATWYILRGLDLQVHSVRFQLRKYYQFMAHAHVKSPRKLPGKSVAVMRATEMHVFLLQAISDFSLTYREVSFQEFVKGVPPSETAVTIVTCEIVEEVESLYRPKLVDAKIFPHGGTNDFLNPEEMLFTTEELHQWDTAFSLLTVTTRKWAQDPTNLRILQYFTAATQVYDAHYAAQPFKSSSPEIAYMVSVRQGLHGRKPGEESKRPPPEPGSTPIPSAPENMAANMPTYYFLQSEEQIREHYMMLMVNKTIMPELTSYVDFCYTHDWSMRRMEAAELEGHLDAWVYDGLEAMIDNVTASFNWTLGQSPGVQRPAPALGAWNNWPPPELAKYCSGVVQLSSNQSGTFSDGHLGRGQYAPRSDCEWVISHQMHLEGLEEVAPGLSPLVVEFPFLFLEPMSELDFVRVVDPNAPHRLLASFRGLVVGGAIRHAGPLAVSFQSSMLRRLNSMELEMGFEARYLQMSCHDDPRGCGAGQCGDDGVCVCPEGRSGVDCGLEHCLGTNVYTLQAGETVTLRSNVAATYSPYADCRWEVHPPAECATCVVDVVFTSLQAELGRDAVHVAAARSTEAFWWEHPPNNTRVHSRSSLDSSELSVRGSPGDAVFVRFIADEIVEEAGFVATARVLDASQVPGGASTSNCYDVQGGQACSGRGVCMPGTAEGELGWCVCDPDFFGRTCWDKVCDLVNAVPQLPTWTLAHTKGRPLIARNSECAWKVAPAPLFNNNGSKSLPPSAVRVVVQEWDFEGARDNLLTLSASTKEVTLQTNRCVSGQECTLIEQCSSREDDTVRPCNQTENINTLDATMPPEFELTLTSGLNSHNAHVTLVIQATFLTPSGHMVVADEAHPTGFVCEPLLGQKTTSLELDLDVMDCLLPPVPTPPVLEAQGYNWVLVFVLVPVLAVLVLTAAALIHRNRWLSRHLTGLKEERMKLNPEAPEIDLDSPLIKVTKYLGRIATKKSFLPRWMLPKNDIAEQAEHLKAMLLQSDNVHRPKLDTEKLQADYGQDIVDFLLVSTCTHRNDPEDSRMGLLADCKGTSTSDSDIACADQHFFDGSSLQSSDASKEMTAEHYKLLDLVGVSYDLDWSLVYSIELKGTLCFVGLKVLERWNLLTLLGISRSKMASFLWAVEDGYLMNPYHNVYHAADVTSRLATMFTRSGLAAHLCETRNGRIQLLGVVLAAAVHDYAHPGTNNAYAVKTAQLYAKIYNDQAVYENSALYQALSLMDKLELDFRANFSQESKRLLRVTIIDLVLATDMSKHFDIVTLVKSKMGSPVAKAVHRPNSNHVESVDNGTTSAREAETQSGKNAGIDLSHLSSEQNILLLQFALKVADIGHCMLPLDQHKFWVTHLETEFFNQGDLERNEGLPISPLMDRTKPGPTNGSNQAGFFEVIVMPTISLWENLLPGSADQLHEQTLSNLIFWRTCTHLEQQSTADIRTDICLSVDTVEASSPSEMSAT